MGSPAHRRHEGIRGRPKKRLRRLHLYLAGRPGADPPDEWIISLLCEAFNCPPDVAIRQPLELSFRIIELRAYARTKAAVDAADSDKQMPKGPMADLVFAVEHEMLKERQARMQAREARREGRSDG